MLTIAIAGLGAIGLPVARRLDSGISGLKLVAVSARDQAAAGGRVAGFKNPPAVVSLAELPALADVVVECCPASQFAALAEATIDAGKIFMPLSVGALLDRMDLVERAAAKGARILVPTGALAGLDAVRAAAVGTIHTARIVTRKPPGGLKGAPYLALHNLDMDAITTPTCIFKGSARDGARGFPANVNVAAALSLAGIGPDRTELEIWADPTVTRNTHRIEIDSDATRLTFTIEGIPSEENPRTGKLTPLSVIACLTGLVSPLKIGT
jgi:aspartate dehydrogenase